MLFWGKGYFLVNCLAKRKEFKKCEANKFVVIRQAFGRWTVCSLFLWYNVTRKDWSLKTEFKLTSELCLYSPVLCVGDAEIWWIAGITTSLVCLLRNVALREVLTGKAAYVSCHCSFYGAVDLSGTSNAPYFFSPVTLLLSVSVCTKSCCYVLTTWCSQGLLALLEMSKAVHNPAHPERKLCALGGYQWGHERNSSEFIQEPYGNVWILIIQTDWCLVCLLK